MARMPKPRLPHLRREKSRHGRVKWFFRQGDGPRIRLPDDYGSEEFKAAYNAALTGAEMPAKPKSRHNQNTLGWLFDMYERSAKFTGLAAGTRKIYGGKIKQIVAQSGDVRLSDITERAIRKGREKRAHKPGAANMFLKVMKAAFDWGVESGLIDENPARNVKAIRVKTDGFEPWTEDDLAAYEARHPLGTMARLALDIYLCTSFRRSDGHLLGKQHIKDGVISYRTKKEGLLVELPLLPRLEQSIEATKTGDLTLLITSRGKPFASPESLSGWIRKRCDEAGVTKSIHGIRKFNAEVVAEGGATHQEMMALFGWLSSDMPTRYAKRANRAHMARRKMHLLDRK